MNVLFAPRAHVSRAHTSQTHTSQTHAPRTRAAFLPILILGLAALLCPPARAQATSSPDTSLSGPTLSPSRPVPTGKAPSMQVKQVSNTPGQQVYAVIFHKGDEALSGITDFALQHHIEDAHFTAIGAVHSATLAWLDLPHKIYRRIPIDEQCEVLSLIGDIATFNGKPVVHMHAVLGHSNGATTGGHVFALNVDPTLEVFVTVNTTPLKKRPDDASGMKLIDPTQ
jgi:uncharacterized protein